METATKAAVGKLIAHWRRRPVAADYDAVRDIVIRAVMENGIRGSIDLSFEEITPSLGAGSVLATITLASPVTAVRDSHGTLIRGVTKIEVEFHRCAGLYDFDAAIRRRAEMDGIAAAHGGDYKAAFAEIDALPWDGEVLYFKVRTDGKARDYRKRYWYSFEGGSVECGSFAFDSCFNGLEAQFRAYVRNLAAQLKIANPAIAYPPETATQVA